MGEDAKQAFINADKKNPDNSTEGGIIIEPKVEPKPPEPEVKIKEPEDAKTTKKMSWDDLILNK